MRQGMGLWLAAQSVSKSNKSFQSVCKSKIDYMSLLKEISLDIQMENY
jgi:hypothetical protein